MHISHLPPANLVDLSLIHCLIVPSVKKGMEGTNRHGTGKKITNSKSVLTFGMSRICADMILCKTDDNMGYNRYEI